MASERAGQLGDDEHRHRSGFDAGEGVAEGPPDGDGRVGEAGGRREVVGAGDVAGHANAATTPVRSVPHRRSRRAARGWRRPRRTRGSRPTAPWSTTRRRKVEHHVGRDGTEDGAGDLGGDVAEGGRRVEAAEDTVDEGDGRVEVSARRRPERKDQGHEHAAVAAAFCRSCRPGSSVRRSAMIPDPTTPGDQERGARELRREPAHNRRYRTAAQSPAERAGRRAPSRRDAVRERPVARWSSRLSGEVEAGDQRHGHGPRSRRGSARTTSRGWPAGSGSSQSS